MKVGSNILEANHKYGPDQKKIGYKNKMDIFGITLRHFLKKKNFPINLRLKDEKINMY